MLKNLTFQLILSLLKGSAAPASRATMQVRVCNKATSLDTLGSKTVVTSPISRLSRGRGRSTPVAKMSGSKITPCLSSVLILPVRLSSRTEGVCSASTRVQVLVPCKGPLTRTVNTSKLLPRSSPMSC